MLANYSLSVTFTEDRKKLLILLYNDAETVPYHFEARSVTNYTPPSKDQVTITIRLHKL